MVFGCSILACHCEYRVDIVIYLVPSCVIYYFSDVDQIMVGVLRIYFNLIVVVYSEMIVLDILNQDW